MFEFWVFKATFGSAGMESVFCLESPLVAVEESLDLKELFLETLSGVDPFLLFIVGKRIS